MKQRSISVDPPYELCATLGFAIKNAFPHSPYDRVFAEKPFFSALNLKVLHQYPTFLKSFARYKRHFCQTGPVSLVQYRPTAFDLGGRLYAQTPSAQLFPKPLRISLFGHSHSDVDMIQAHYELVRRLSQSQHLRSLGGGEAGCPRSRWEVSRGCRLMHEGCAACMVHGSGLVWCQRMWKRNPWGTSGSHGC